MKKPLQLPEIPESEQSPLVKCLLAIIAHLQEQNQLQQEQIQQLRDEIAILKGEKAKPKFKSSKMEQNTDPDDSDDDDKPTGQRSSGQSGNKRKKRAGSNKRSKTVQLTIHDIQIIPCENAPTGARHNGYRDVVIQGLIFQAHNIRYRLEVFVDANGKSHVAQLPASLRNHRFDEILRGFIIYQHHHCGTTQPLILEQLREVGVDISAGQINAILSQRHDVLHTEKDEILETGLEISAHVSVDDSGARHAARNGYVTQIGNDYFAWFASTASKSRVNFLELLQAGNRGYQITEDALAYMETHGLRKTLRLELSEHLTTPIYDEKLWRLHLAFYGFETDHQIRIATEAALVGHLLTNGFNPNLVIVSDGARQFALFLHGLCWVHTERLIHKLIPSNDLQRQAIKSVRAQVWDFYRDLKAYKAAPDATQIPIFEARFDEIFTQRTQCATLNELLKRTHQRKEELLLVLRRPEIPLHTNGSENDIRCYVQKQKISGGTRSELGRKCRDTFTSLKKTCRKLGMSFWQYLQDRLTLKNNILPLPELMRNAAQNAALP